MEPRPVVVAGAWFAEIVAAAGAAGIGASDCLAVAGQNQPIACWLAAFVQHSGNSPCFGDLLDFVQHSGILPCLGDLLD